MSVSRAIIFVCDANKVGLPLCLHQHTEKEGTVNQGRKEMKRRGWSRRHHNDIVVDLCYPCTGEAMRTGAIRTPDNIGRPRKVSA